MNVRDLKLAIACGTESDEIKALNKFFDDLFSDISVYTDGIKPDLIFMKGDKFIMQYDINLGYLNCAHNELWAVLLNQYHCAYEEIQDIIIYKVSETFNIDSWFIPRWSYIEDADTVEYAFKNNKLTLLNNVKIKD